MKYFYTLTCFLVCSSIGYSQVLKTPTLSPFSKISQEIGLTEVSLTYSRPSAKGRTVFSGLVPYNKVWRTGANASTKIKFNESLHIGGESIKAGTYALYTIPAEDKWTIIIYGDTKLRSLAGNAYNQANDVFRFEVTPVITNHFVETFTIQFADLHANACNLQLSWEHTLINIPIEVEVDKKIDQQIMELMKKPEDIAHRTYFEAAQYYLNNKKDLGEALAFIDAGLVKSPENFRYGLLKSKIQYKAGDKEAALITIDQAHTWAKNAKNDNYIEQTALFKESM